MPCSTSPHTDIATHPFHSAEALWFWFLHPALRGSKRTGSCLMRPCTTDDVVRLIERLYRQRHLTLDHIRILRHYGVRARRPDPSRYQERHAHHLWSEAMKRLEAAFERAGWVQCRLRRAVIDLSLERVLKASV